MNNHAMAKHFTTVRLLPAQWERAAQVGVRRRLFSMQHGCKQKYGNDGCDSWTQDIEGAAGEMIVAEVLRATWHTAQESFERKRPDVGDFIDVRTAAKDHYRLIVHDEDPDGHAMVSVTGRMPVLTIRGWLWAADAKRTKYRADPTRENRWAFFVPTRDLFEFSELFKYMTEP